MLQDFRRVNAVAEAGYLEGLKADVLGGEESVGQLAGVLTAGKGDRFGLSESLLYAALEGTRKIAPHKVGMLALVTGRHAALDAINVAAGFLPPVRRPEGRVSLARAAEVLQVMGAFLEGLAAAQDPRGDAGFLITAEEAGRLEENGLAVASMVLGLVEVGLAAARVRDGRACTLADAEQMRNVERGTRNRE